MTGFRAGAGPVRPDGLPGAVARWPAGTLRTGDKKNPVTAGGEPVTGLKRATGVSPGAHVSSEAAGAALAAGWEPESRGKPMVFTVDADGN